MRATDPQRKRRLKALHGNTSRAGPDPLFFASLMSSLIPSRAAGSSTPSFTRATAAVIPDNEGVLRTVNAGEARFWGARRVENLVTKSQDFTNAAAWNSVSGNTSATAGFADPFGGTQAQKIVDNAANNAHFVFQGNSGSKTAANRTWIWSVYVKAVDTGTAEPVYIQVLDGLSAHGAKFCINVRTGAIVTAGTLLGAATGLVANAVFDAATGWWRMYVGCSMPSAATGQAVGYVVFNNNNFYVGTGTGFLIYNGQLEDTTGQSVQLPAERVSTGVLASPFQGANVDGVQYFTATLAGAPLPLSSLFGVWYEQAGTQLVTPTASIRLVSDASWVKAGAPTITTTTGADGVANACNRIASVAGNTTLLQTLVGAAVGRTFSVYIKRISGTGNIDLTQDGATFTNINGSLIPNQWVRVLLNVTQLNPVFGVRIVTSGDVIEMDMMQLETTTANSLGATTPMLTSGASRNAESLSYSAAGNFVDGLGTMSVEATPYHASLNAVDLVSVSGSSREVLLASTTTVGSVDNTPTNLSSGAGTNWSPTFPRRVAAAWSTAANSRSVVGNTCALATGAHGTFAGSGNLVLGINGSGTIQYIGGLKNLKILGIRTPDAQLSAQVA